MPDGVDDWALVVGIARYPNYGPTPDEANDLRGPVNDAMDVAAVLRDVYKVANIKTITSDGVDGQPWPTNGPHPVKSEIEAWFRDLRIRSAANRKEGREPKIGNRAYIYLSGHGVAPKRRDRALVTAESLSQGQIDHLLATDWHDGLLNTGYFSEYVLWMDCCTQAKVTLTPSAPPFTTTAALNPQPRAMVASAAKFPLEAIELPIGPAGAYRGIFTYELVAGLRGAAANPLKGGITTADLCGFLYDRVKARVEQLPDATNVSREPEFLQQDEIVFRTPAEAPSQAPMATIPVAVPDGTMVTISDSRNAPVATVAVAAGVIKNPLPDGLYRLAAGGQTRLVQVAGGEVVL